MNTFPVNDDVPVPRWKKQSPVVDVTDVTFIIADAYTVPVVTAVNVLAPLFEQGVVSLMYVLSPALFSAIVDIKIDSFKQGVRV